MLRQSLTIPTPFYIPIHGKVQTPYFLKLNSQTANHVEKNSI